jgi:hypothetical protein
MALSDPVRAELKAIYNALADKVLASTDPEYVAELNERTASGRDAVSEIAAEIDFQEGGGICLFTGQRGTGKSTELRRLQDKLESIGVIALYADLSEYLLLTKPIEITDFLVSLAGAFSDRAQADPRFGRSLQGRSYWDRLAAFLRSEVEFKELNVKVADAVELKAALKNDPDFKQRVQKGARGHVTRLVREAHEFFALAAEAVRAHLGRRDVKLAFIVDSVERVRGVGDEAMTVYESVRNLFLAHGEHLRIPGLHMVYTVPPYLSVLAAGAGAMMGGATVRRLVSTHIFQPRSREVDPEGTRLMRLVVAKRYMAWDRVYSEQALSRLALSSGGDLREYFRLLRMSLPAVRDDAQLPLSAEAVAHVETAARAEMLPIPADQLDWLKRIAQTHETCLKSDDQLPQLAHFLDNRLVLNYRNGSDWYDVHPLIRDVIDAHVPNRAGPAA